MTSIDGSTAGRAEARPAVVRHRRRWLEIGVFLDALMGFIVMQIFIYQIHETFESIDVEQLNRLRH